MSKRLLAAALALVALSGCYTISYNTKAPGGGGYKEDRGDFFLWGLVGDETFDLTKMCPRGVSRWKSEQNFVDGVIGVVTLGIYVRRHVTVECAGGAAYQLDLDGDGQVLAAAQEVRP